MWCGGTAAGRPGQCGGGGVAQMRVHPCLFQQSLWSHPPREAIAVVQSLSRVRLCNPMDCSTPGFPVLHYLPELAQTYVHWVNDAIQLSDSLSLPFLLLPSVFPSIRVFSKELALHIRWPKHWSFSFSISPPVNIQDWFSLGFTGLISLLSKGLSRVFSSITAWKYQFFSTQSSLWSNSHFHVWLLEKS